MNPVRCALAAAALLLAGCYTGPPSTADHQFEDPNALMMPLGWVGAAPTVRRASIGGIYPVRQQRQYCCWMGSDASLAVRAPAGTRTMLTTIFIPNLPLFAEHSQTLTIAVAGGAPTRFARLTPGLHFLRVPLRAANRARVLTLSLHAGFTFSPLREHLNGDSRELSLYVKSVRAE